MALYKLICQRQDKTTWHNNATNKTHTIRLDTRYLNEIPFPISVDELGRISIQLDTEYHFRKLRIHLLKVQTQHPVMQPSNKQLGSFVVSKIGKDWCLVICNAVAQTEREFDLGREQFNNYANFHRRNF